MISGLFKFRPTSSSNPGNISTTTSFSGMEKAFLGPSFKCIQYIYIFAHYKPPGLDQPTLPHFTSPLPPPSQHNPGPSRLRHIIKIIRCRQPPPYLPTTPLLLNTTVARLDFATSSKSFVLGSPHPSTTPISNLPTTMARNPKICLSANTRPGQYDVPPPNPLVHTAGFCPSPPSSVGRKRRGWKCSGSGLTRGL